MCIGLKWVYMIGCVRGGKGGKGYNTEVVLVKKYFVSC